MFEKNIDTPDIYSMIGAVANKITEIPNVLQSKIELEKRALELELQKQ